MNKRLTPEKAASSADAVEHALRARAKADLKAASQKKADERRLQALWQQQEELLLTAALEGETSLLLTGNELVLPARLIDLGFSLLATSISRATEAREQTVLARVSKKSNDLHAKLLQETEHWVRAAVKIDVGLRPHKDRIHSAILTFLLERCTTHVDLESFSLMEEIDSAPYEVLSLLASGITSELEGFPETDRLERTFRDYSLSFLELQSAKNDFDERRNTPTVPIDSTRANLLGPPTRVSWKSSVGIQAWPDRPLVHADSFAWISGTNGQVMLRFLEVEITNRADEGIRSLDVSVACPLSAAPTVRMDGAKSRPLCPPASELQALLTILKWNVKLSAIDADATRLSITW